MSNKISRGNGIILCFGVKLGGDVVLVFTAMIFGGDKRDIPALFPISSSRDKRAMSDVEFSYFGSEQIIDK
ncbi:hypothetical protein [Musicola keenii]|uniref:hypothetical protein n=1 Tax=Musicola keenii TaxID=2884250 RepID=UPI001CE31B52|nr:hypothetical protein [Musicola keenii]